MGSSLRAGGRSSIEFCCVGLVLHRPNRIQIARTSELVAVQKQLDKRRAAVQLRRDLAYRGGGGGGSTFIPYVGLVLHRHNRTKKSRTFELIRAQVERRAGGLPSRSVPQLGRA